MMGFSDRLRDTLEATLRAMGVGAGKPAAHDRSRDEELFVLLDLRGERILVGRLRREAGEFVFAYDRSFAMRVDLPRLPDFPETDHEYRSTHLWPFFLVRLPPSDRADVRQAIEQTGVDADNQLELLGHFGRRAVSSPYELEVRHAH